MSTRASRRGRETTVIGAIGDRELLATLPLEAIPPASSRCCRSSSHTSSSRASSTPDPTVIEIRGRRIGDGFFGLIAGPCTVETREQTLETARAVAAAGATHAARRRVQAAHVAVRVPGPRRRGARRSSPRRARRPGCRSSPSCWTRATWSDGGAIADVIQIGARNMANFNLLAEVGRVRKPVLLKRGPSATVEELLMAAEYVAKEGNERGHALRARHQDLRASTRYTLDLGACRCSSARRTCR